jgi:hypothetical protein
MPKHNTEEKFWALVSPEPNSGCWLWTGATLHHGHGTVSFNGRYWQAHRLAWTFTNGAIPEGAFICHRCNVSACCNPAHLYAGNAKTNHDDMAAIGRGVRSKIGSKMHCAKLDEALVGKIRMRYSAGGVTQAELARQHGVAQSNVSRAITGARWKHVE